MAWYEAHQTLAKHPKTLRLASLINCERRYAVGLLHDLFTWGLDAAKRDGSLPGLSASEIATALDYSGKKGLAVVAALVESGYLEQGETGYKIHDWYDYAGKFVDQRETDKQRKQEARNKKLNAENADKSGGCPTDVRRTNNGNPPVTVPNLTVPNLTLQENNNKKEKQGKEKSGHESENDLGRVMTFFFDKVNPSPSPMCIDMLKCYTASLGADVVLHALGIALDERKTSWSYIRAILGRYERDGLKDLQAVLDAEQRHNAKKEPAEAEKPAKQRERPVDILNDLVEYPYGSGQYRPRWEVPDDDGI